MLSVHLLSVTMHAIAHDCSLPKEEDILVSYIDSGWFVYQRRQFRQFLLVDKRHPFCRTVFKSPTAIRQERTRHLQHHYYMVHPFSVGRAYWQFFMIFVWTCALTIIPINFSGDVSMMELRYTKITFDFLSCADIAVTFFTGVYNRQAQTISLKPQAIAKKYIFSYLIVDLCSSIPIHFIATMVFGYQEDYPTLELVVFVKTFRFVTLMRYLDVLRDWFNFSIYKFKIFKLIMFSFLLLLWCSSVNYVIAKSHVSSWIHTTAVQQTLVDGLIHGCFKSTYVLLLIGHSDTPVKSLVIKILQTIGLQAGFVLKLYFLSQVVQILHKYNTSSNKYEQHMKQLNEFARYKGLPDWMKRRLCRYTDFKYQKHFVKANEILSILTPQLRQEILLQECREFLEKVVFFQGLPTSILVRVISHLKVVIVLSNDVIIRAGSDGDSMYFISFGTVAVYTSHGKEICHLGDGAYFGEIALVIDEKRVASVVAVDACELLELNRNDFRSAIEPYPEYFSRLKKIAQDRLHRVRSTTGSTDDPPKI